MVKPVPQLAVLAALALAGCQQSASSTPRPSKVPAAKVVGEPLSCISINHIRNSRVRDDSTIDFEMTGGKVYRNTLPNSCPRLGFEEGFLYETSMSQLCSVDIIYVLERSGGMTHRGAGCGLGKFVPVEIEKKK